MSPRWWAPALALGVHVLVFCWPVVRPPEPRAPSTVALSLAPRWAPSPGAASPFPSPAPAPEEPARAPTPDAGVAPRLNSSEAPSGPVGAETPTGEVVHGLPAATETDTETGTDTDTEFDFDAWAAQVRQGVDAHKVYPYAARSRGLEGRVTLVVSVTPEGTLAREPRFVRSSGYPSLDRAAVTAVNQAVPFPGVPAGLPREVELTLVFTLR